MSEASPSSGRPLDVESGLPSTGDESSAPGDASRTAAAPAQLALLPKLCRWCKGEVEASKRIDSQFCSPACKQTAHRLRRRRNASHGPNDRVLTFAYADPPYPGLAQRYYGDQPTFAGEVDHRELVSRLSADGALSGWALSTSAEALHQVLPLCPPGARVCAWVKPGGVPPSTYGLHNRWEPLIVCGGRMRQPGIRDWLLAQPARGGGELPGRKPLEFCLWLFELLGMLPGDSLLDLFPGTGVVLRSWVEFSSAAAAETFARKHERSSTTSSPVSPRAAETAPPLPAATPIDIGSPAIGYASIRR